MNLEEIKIGESHY